VVRDNLSAHKTKDVEQFLADHPEVRFHFTPTYSSWLNQVERWFAKIQRDVIAPRRVHPGRRSRQQAS
jgi:transposase